MNASAKSHAVRRCKHRTSGAALASRCCCRRMLRSHLTDGALRSHLALCGRRCLGLVSARASPSSIASTITVSRSTSAMYLSDTHARSLGAASSAATMSCRLARYTADSPLMTLQSSRYQQSAAPAQPRRRHGQACSRSSLETAACGRPQSLQRLMRVATRRPCARCSKTLPCERHQRAASCKARRRHARMSVLQIGPDGRVNTTTSRYSLKRRRCQRGLDQQCC